jgi:hypothetical protein
MMIVCGDHIRSAHLLHKKMTKNRKVLRRIPTKYWTMRVYGTGMNCCLAPTRNRWPAALPRLGKGIGPLVFACRQWSNALRRRSSPPRWLNMWSNIWSSVQACEVFCVFIWIDNTKLTSCFCKSFQMINSTKPEKDVSKYESCGTFFIWKMLSN